MNENNLNNFQDFEKKQLVIKITGEVQESNLDAFENQAHAVLSSINTNLQTDSDFAEAEFNAKLCKTIESRIHNARQDAIMQTADIATIIQTTERLEAKFREMRLSLEKLVVREKEARKAEIINTGRNYIQGLLVTSPVKHGFIVDNKAFTEAAKGKRSLDKIREAVAEVVESEELRLANMEADYLANIERISTSEAEYPGLYPDRKTLALSTQEVVESQISARVATFRLETAEKERAELAAVMPVPHVEEKVISPPVFVPPPPPDFLSTDVEPEKHHTLEVKIMTNNDIDVLKSLILEQPGVYSVREI